MSYGISVDVGTSYTAAAIARSGEAPQVLPLGLRAASIPTVIFLGTDGVSVVGEAAERRGQSQPERLAREFKRRIGDSVPLVMGELSVLAEDLYATMVRHVVDLAEEREGSAPSSVTLTHPAEWGGHKLESVRRAVAGVGITEVMLITEPEAAALSYASSQRVAAGTTLAVYDLGGGTFDATVLRKADSESFAVLGNPMGLDRLGGADFDQAVFTHVVESLPEVFATLDPSSEDVLPALARLRRECAEAKEALSTDADTTIPVYLPGAYEQVRLVRSEFEAMIEQDLRDTLGILAAALAGAGVEAQELSAILLIGGSSRIPLVAQLLSSEFERPLAVDADPKASIALGAAFATAALTEEPAAAAGADTEPADSHDASALTPAGFTPHHGPEAMATNRKLGMRAALLVGAITLIGVATASAAGTGSPLAVLSSITGGDQRAEAAPGNSVSATPEDGGSTADASEDGESPATDGAADSSADPAAEQEPGAAPGGAGSKAEKTKDGESAEKNGKNGKNGKTDKAGKTDKDPGKSRPGSSAGPSSSKSSSPSRSSEADEDARPSSTPSRTPARPGGSASTSRPSTSAPGTPTPGNSTPGSQSPVAPVPGTPSPGTQTPGTPNPGTPSPGTNTPGTTPPVTPPPADVPPPVIVPDPAPPTPQAPETQVPTTQAPVVSPGPVPGQADGGAQSVLPGEEPPATQRATGAPTEGQQ